MDHQSSTLAAERRVLVALGLALLLCFGVWLLVVGPILWRAAGF